MHAEETLQVYDVTTPRPRSPPAVLGQTAIYTDLGSGVFFADFDVNTR